MDKVFLLLFFQKKKRFPSPQAEINRPATASSFAINSGLRFSGAVMIA
jgi:hypothetical protein